MREEAIQQEAKPDKYDVLLRGQVTDTVLLGERDQKPQLGKIPQLENVPAETAKRSQPGEPLDPAATEAKLCVDAVNATIRAAQEHDPVRCAMSIASLSALVAGTDPTARCALAVYLISLARELDEDVFGARLH